MNECPPQRFRWKSKGSARWKYGVMLLNYTHAVWEIHTFGLHPIGMWDPLVRQLHLGPTEEIAKIIGPVSAFQWLDSEHGWRVVEPE